MFGIDLAVSIMDGPDSDIRIDAVKDMVREFKHVYPEIAEI